MQALKSSLTRSEDGSILGNVGFAKNVLGVLFESTVNTRNGEWSLTVEHDNTYIPNVKSKSEFGAEVGDDDQRTPFFKCSSEYSNEYLVASATVDPFKSEVEFQATSQYSSFAVGVASQYCLRSGQDDEEKGSCWMPPALKAQWRSDDENLEIGLKYIPTRYLSPWPRPLSRAACSQAAQSDLITDYPATQSRNANMRRCPP